VSDLVASREVLCGRRQVAHAPRTVPAPVLCQVSDKWREKVAGGREITASRAWAGQQSLRLFGRPRWF